MSSDTSSRSSGSPCSSPTPGSNKPTTTNKRCNKPQMERKRRERINGSLNVLKQLVLDALKKDTSQYSKLEKADILEMTVKHLRDLQRRQLATAATNDVTVVGKYRAGFTECATEVTRYLSTVDGLRPEVRDRLLSHLSTCVQRVNSPPLVDQQSHARHAMTSSTPVAAMPATRPIQIQIPVATSPGALPGAGVQALQLATSLGNDIAASAASATPRTQSTSPPHHSGATYSPVAAQTYIGAFQVIPNAQATTFMLQQNGGCHPVNIVNATNPTPVYVSTSPTMQQVAPPVQPQQQQQQKLQQQHSMLQAHALHKKLKRDAPSEHFEGPVMKKAMYYHQSSCGGVQASGKLAINETLRDEKVWRPW